MTDRCTLLDSGVDDRVVLAKVDVVDDLELLGVEVGIDADDLVRADDVDVDILVVGREAGEMRARPSLDVPDEFVIVGSEDERAAPPVQATAAYS